MTHLEHVGALAPPDYPGFPSKAQALKARVPMARIAAARDVARPDPRGQLVGIIASGLSLGDPSADPDADAEELLARYEATLR